MHNPATFQQRNESLVKRTLRAAMHGMDRLFGHYSLVGDQPVFDPALFPWTKHLEENWTTIRKELDTVLAYRDALPNFHDITPDVKTITRDDQWKTFFFYGFGHKAEQNCALCPETTALIESVPGMQTAFFSILSPGKHIPDHRGPYKGILRYHLGLKVPEPAERCRIRVDQQVHHWEEGESLVFDDTYRHEVWNETSDERAILFMDIERPLPPTMATLNRLIMRLLARSSVVQDAQANQAQWERRLEAAVSQQSDAAS